MFKLLNFLFQGFNLRRFGGIAGRNLRGSDGICVRTVLGEGGDAHLQAGKRYDYKLLEFHVCRFHFNETSGCPVSGSFDFISTPPAFWSALNGSCAKVFQPHTFGLVNLRDL